MKKNPPLNYFNYLKGMRKAIKKKNFKTSNHLKYLFDTHSHLYDSLSNNKVRLKLDCEEDYELLSAFIDATRLLCAIPLTYRPEQCRFLNDDDLPLIEVNKKENIIAFWFRDVPPNVAAYAYVTNLFFQRLSIKPVTKYEFSILLLYTGQREYVFGLNCESCYNFGSRSFTHETSNLLPADVNKNYSYVQDFNYKYNHLQILHVTLLAEIVNLIARSDVINQFPYLIYKLPDSFGIGLRCIEIEKE